MITPFTTVCMTALVCAVKPPNQEHIGNLAVVSFVGSMSSLGGSKCGKTTGKPII